MSAGDRNLDIEWLRSHLRYEPRTGKLFWRRGRFAGKQVTTPHPRGGISLKLKKRMYLAHRVIWAIHYGVWPTRLLDHANRNRKDNRISNLRECDYFQNRANTSFCRSGTSKFIGVIRSRSSEPSWSASITVRGVCTKLGKFANEEDAARAYDAAKRAAYGEFAATNFPILRAAA